MIIVLALILLFSACRSEADGPEPGVDPAADEAPASGDDDLAEAADGATIASDDRPRRREVKLGLTDWTGSRITLAIAELIIERQLGYPVTAEPVREYGEMFSALADGDLDAILELWPSTLTESELSYLESGRVSDLGPLGVDGRVGWYVPRYVIDDDPDLASWEGFTGPSVADRFETSDTVGGGRFVGIDPSYEQFDDELIKALDLDFEVVYSGSEQESRALLAQATADRAPILMYWWSPTAEITEFDLVKVELPVRTSDCLEDHAQGRPMACDYPTDELFKVGNPDLHDSDPDLARLLSAFTLSTSDQLAMIHAVEVEGQSISDVAEQWVTDNRAEWSAWIS